MKAVRSLTVDIDYMPHLCHPLVGGFIDPDLELTESQINAIRDAIICAQKLMYEDKKLTENCIILRWTLKWSTNPPII
jgi:hypothetical protein